MKSFTSKLQSPKAMNNVKALAGLLTYSPFCPAFPFRPDNYRDFEQWPFEQAMVNGAYSCGTVTELHRIPF